jgi:hypothetical protein
MDKTVFRTEFIIVILLHKDKQKKKRSILVDPSSNYQNTKPYNVVSATLSIKKFCPANHPSLFELTVVFITPGKS